MTDTILHAGSAEAMFSSLESSNLLAILSAVPSSYGAAIAGIMGQSPINSTMWSRSYSPLFKTTLGQQSITPNISGSGSCVALLDTVAMNIVAYDEVSVALTASSPVQVSAFSFIFGGVQNGAPIWNPAAPSVLAIPSSNDGWTVLPPSMYATDPDGDDVSYIAITNGFAVPI